MRQNEKRFISILAATFILLIGISFAAPSKEITNQTITYLIDTTVDNRKELISILAREETKLTSLRRNTKLQHLGKTYKFATIGERGESISFSEVVFSKVPGDRAKNIKEGIKNLKRAFKKAKRKVQKGKGQNQTLLIEQISRALEDTDKLLIFSDMCQVDKKRNFERLRFGSPVDLSNQVDGKEIEIIRIPRKGQTWRHSQLINAWWDASLFGESKNWKKLTTRHRGHRKSLI